MKSSGCNILQMMGGKPLREILGNFKQAHNQNSWDPLLAAEDNWLFRHPADVERVMGQLHTSFLSLASAWLMSGAVKGTVPASTTPCASSGVCFAISANKAAAILLSESSGSCKTGKTFLQNHKSLGCPEWVFQQLCLLELLK